MTDTEDPADDGYGDSDEPDGPTCGSTDTRDGSPCQRAVSSRGDRCFLHDQDGPPADYGAPEGNTNALRNDGGPPPANGNAERHGLYADRSKYYRRLDDDEQAWIDALIDAWLDDAPFDHDHLAGLELLRKTAIDEHKRRQANAYIEREGVITENVVDYDDGDPIVKKAENPAHLPYSRLAKDTIRTLKQIGVLQDPDTQLADATASWGEAVKHAAKRRDTGDSDSGDPGGESHR
jgi:hypothetical protein